MSQKTIELKGVKLNFPRGRPSLLSLFKRLIGIKKSREQFTALNGIDMDINRGEVVGIIGKNGSGKSTLLRVISGVYQPDEGLVRSAGRVTLLASLNIGFHGNLTGTENAYVFGSILGHSRKQMTELMPEIIDFAEIEEFMEEPLRTYSAGMRARIGLAVASAVGPELLLIDEVLGAGDAAFRKKSAKRIREMVNDAGSVVIVSHNLNFLQDMCSRIILVEKGEIVSQGSPEVVIAEYKGR